MRSGLCISVAYMLIRSYPLICATHVLKNFPEAMFLIAHDVPPMFQVQALSKSFRVGQLSPGYLLNLVT